jgi:hypothetical protein
MISLAGECDWYGQRAIVRGAKAALLTIFVLFGSLLPDRPVDASTVLNAASANANAGLSACSNSSGKALYNCVADVLDGMSAEIARIGAPDTRNALQTAASKLRAATSKAAAISAITQCQAAIAGALRQVKAAGGAIVRGWGDSGLASVVSVLSRAVKLIQAKG